MLFEKSKLLRTFSWMQHKNTFFQKRKKLTLKRGNENRLNTKFRGSSSRRTWFRRPVVGVREGGGKDNRTLGDGSA